jgi:dihydroneopterin aldolase
MTPATIIIRNLTVDTVIGVYPEERRASQKLKLDLELGIDGSSAGRSDRLRDTVDYDQVASSVRRFGRETSAELLEHFVYRLGLALLREFPLRNVTLTAWKRVAGLLPAEVAVKVEIDASERHGTWDDDGLED